MKQILMNLLTGIATGSTIFVVMVMILTASGLEIGQIFAAHSFSAAALGGMLIGVGYSVPSLVYHAVKLPMGLKILIHMGIGTAVFTAVAIALDWIPMQLGVAGVLGFFAIGIACAFAIWAVFFFYNHKKVKQMNHMIREKQKENVH